VWHCCVYGSGKVRPITSSYIILLSWMGCDMCSQGFIQKFVVGGGRGLLLVGVSEGGVGAKLGL